MGSGRPVPTPPLPARPCLPRPTWNSGARGGLGSASQVASVLPGGGINLSHLPGPTVVAATQQTRKQRELYVGNLPVGMVTAAQLKELFRAPLLCAARCGEKILHDTEPPRHEPTSRREQVSILPTICYRWRDRLHGSQNVTRNEKMKRAAKIQSSH